MSASRSSGILLHITSLPGPFGIGDLGAAAYRFADTLSEARQRLWQVLPLGPVGAGASPYSSPSTFAGNPLLISPEPLAERGLLKEKELAPAAKLPKKRVDYARVTPFKENLLEKAFARFDAEASAQDRKPFEQFRRRHADWLQDYTLFMALKEANDGAPWTAWDAELARRETDALTRARRKHARVIRKHAFWQYLFYRQWNALRDYCHTRDIAFFGDLPIYVAHDSADVWAHQDLFHLRKDGQPTIAAGVPPDYFSETGQLWGNPIYRWERMRENGFVWWKRRFKALLRRVDLVRMDHFRGFEAYWAVPASAETAVEGTWKKGPGLEFFEALRKDLGTLPLVAEDLGIITPEVRTLMREIGAPGMAVLSFGFEGGPSSEYMPHHYRRALVSYTGTHDNEPIAGWYANTADEEACAYARRYLGLNGSASSLHLRCLRTLMASVAERVVFPLQDVLGLGSEARMNTPGQPEDNWTWRFRSEQLTEKTVERLRTLTETYDRAPDEAAE